jgi:hypothetical protein
VTRYPPAAPDEFEPADLGKGTASTMRSQSGSDAAWAGGRLDSTLGEFLEAVGRTDTLDATFIPGGYQESASFALSGQLTSLPTIVGLASHRWPGAAVVNADRSRKPSS